MVNPTRPGGLKSSASRQTRRPSKKKKTSKKKAKNVSTVTSDLLPAIVGLLYPIPYSIIMLYATSENSAITSWTCHVATGFSVPDCAVILSTLAHAGYLTQVFDPTPFGGVAISVYKVPHYVSIRGETLDPCSNESIQTMSEFVAWARKRTDIRITSE